MTEKNKIKYQKVDSWYENSKYRSDIQADYYSFLEGYELAERESAAEIEDLKNQLRLLTKFKQQL